MSLEEGFHINIESISLVTGAFSGTTSPEGSSLNLEDSWFNASDWLGRKGHRYFSEPVKYTLAAAQQLSFERELEHSAVMIGTSTIDQAVRQDIASKLWRQSEETIGAASAPNCSVNIAAGQLSSKYRMFGSCYTFTGSDDVGCIAMWKALRDLRKGDISSAVIGQVEHIEGSTANSGAMLWHLSTKQTNESCHSINSLSWHRWRPENSETFVSENLTSLQNHSRHVYLLGRNSKVFNELADQLQAQQFLVEQLELPALSQGVLPSMQLFFTLSLAALKKMQGTVLLVFDNGHIFNLNMN